VDTDTAPLTLLRFKLPAKPNSVGWGDDADECEDPELDVAEELADMEEEDLLQLAFKDKEGGASAPRTAGDVVKAAA